jgi:hypothetical protein
MTGLWGSLRRSRVAALACVVALAATAGWASPAQAVGVAIRGKIIAPVGYPKVIQFQFTSRTSSQPAAKRLHKPFLSINPGALAKAKRAAAARGGANPPGRLATPGSSSLAAGPQTGLFNGINQPGISALDESFCCTPPDSTGAVGPNNYVEFVNTTIRVYDRALNQMSQQDMASFVAAPSGLNVSDPQIQWDPRAGRWFYTAVAFATHNNYLVFGWSKTADPSDLAGGWCRLGISTGNQLADYPKLGHDDNYVLFGANLYDDSTGNFVFNTANIWALPKPAAGSATCSASGMVSFADAQHVLLNTDRTSAFTPVPANTSDASSSGYVVAGHSPLPPRTGDPLGPQTKVMLWHVTRQGGVPRLTADSDVTVGSFDVPAAAPQPGGPTLETLDARLTQAVAHADPDAGGAEAVWTQHTIDGTGGRSVVRWYEILPAATVVRQQGQIQSATDFIWNGSISPSIAGNDAAVFYNRGGSTQLPLVAAQSRLSATPLGTMAGGEIVLATSTEADVDFSCTSPYGPPCRWGDYSGASPDPLNAGVVWGTNQVNGTSFFGFPQWATQNYAVTTSGTAPPPPTPCTSVTWNAPSPASPQAPGSQVTLSASASGCPNPQYQFWFQPPGGSWTILQAYGPASSATWNTTGLAGGTYSLDVWVKQSGSGASWEAHMSPNPTYTLQAGPACTSVIWNAPSPASPQAPGTSVTFSATASGCPSPLYQFWVQAPGGPWTILRAYSAANSATWNTTGLAAGTYSFDAWVKQTGSGAGSFEAHLSPNPTYTLQNPSAPPCTSVTWSAPSPASPQAPGTPITFNASASGCPNPLYQFWVQPPGGSWTTLQAYSSANSVSWNTTGLATGIYSFDAWVKQSGSGSSSFEAHLSPNPTYTLQTGSPCTSVTWNAPSPTSPQPPGTSVTFSAGASGCPNPVYQFWVQPPGGAWTILKAYSSASSVAWNTTGLPAGTYSFDAWAKQSGSTASWEAHLVPNPTYTLQNPSPPPCTSVAWNPPSPAAPSAPGALVTLSGTATGCSSPQYQFWIQPPGGGWTVLQAYGSASSASWNTTGQVTGTYYFDIWVRQSGSSAAWESHLVPNPSYTLQTGSPCTLVTWNAPSPSSPQKPGTSVTFSATAGGCPNPQYEFWVQAPGGSWTVLQAYGSASSATWSTTGLATGTYNFDAHVRQAGSGASFEAHLSPSPTYTLQAGPPCTSVTWNAPSPASPQPPGTAVTLSAGASGCPNALYEFWIQAPGGAWTILQAYGPNATATWNTAGLPAGTYYFDVWVKQSGSSANWEAHLAPNPTFTLGP